MRNGFLIFALIVASMASGAEKAFEATEPGTTEVKILPSGRLLVAESDQSYFSESNGLFRPLFRYIQQHNISMTSPVEAKIDPGKMYFWVAEDQVDKAKEDWGGVTVTDVPSRTVAAIGVRGAYGRSNYEEARKELIDWVKDQEDLEMVGEPYGVFWDGPFTPWFLKTFEVHVEVSRGK